MATNGTPTLLPVRLVLPSVQPPDSDRTGEESAGPMAWCDAAGLLEPANRDRGGTVSGLLLIRPE
jgi:hypothetical protein